MTDTKQNNYFKQLKQLQQIITIDYMSKKKKKTWPERPEKEIELSCPGCYEKLLSIL